MNTAKPEPRSFAQTQFVLPANCLLEGFAIAATGSSGLCLQNLKAHDLIVFRTANSEYRVQVIDPARRRVKVQGGKLFAQPAEAVLVGASYGGAMIRLGWICVGMQLEIIRHTTDNRAINFITSPVETIRLEASL